MEDLKKSVGEKLNRLDREVKALNNLADTQFVTRHNLPGLVSEKIEKSDILTLIPDLAALEGRMKVFTNEMGHGIEERTQEMLKKLDQRLVGLRREIDIDSFKQLVSVKADKHQVEGDLENHEFKIMTLDRNLVCIANDFENF